MAVEAAQLGMWDSDRRTGQSVMSAIAARLLGLPAGGLGNAGRFLAAVRPDDRASVQQAISAAIAQRSQYEVEYRVMWPDGSVRWMEARGHPLYDLAGEPIRLVGTVRGITVRKQATEA